MRFQWEAGEGGRRREEMGRKDARQSWVPEEMGGKELAL